MTMASYFERYKEKWVTVQTSEGSLAYINGVLKEVGDDYLVLKITENEEPLLLTYRHIVSFKPMKMKENGKPKLFG